jgi:hypothetical protein
MITPTDGGINWRRYQSGAPLLAIRLQCRFTRSCGPRQYHDGEVGMNEGMKYICQWTLYGICKINHIKRLSRTERKAATVRLALYYSSEPISSNEQTNAAPKPAPSLGYSPPQIRSF